MRNPVNLADTRKHTALLHATPPMKKNGATPLGEWVAPKRASGAGKTRRNLLMVIAA